MIINMDARNYQPIMICKRCGQCCFHLDIFIINPRSILPDGTVSSDDPEAMIFKPAQQMCPHLAIEDDRATTTATCTIHHLPCYRGTPCEQFEQLGPAEDICFMSGYFQLQGGGYANPIHEKIKIIRLPGGLER